MREGSIYAYQKAQQVHWRERVEQHLGMVRRTARRMADRLGLPQVQEDLMQAGFIGLIEAARRFDPTQQVDFVAYARKRVEGAIIDEVRSQDWRPRRVSKRAVAISETIADLQQRLGRAPSGSEVAKAMGQTIIEYHRSLGDIELGNLCPLGDENLHGDFYGQEPFDENRDEDSSQKASLGPLPSNNELHEQVTALLRQLPNKEQQVLYFYYVKEMNQAEIADVLGVSTARVSQLHKQSLIRLKSIVA